jgi:hypothetical protein
MIHLWTTVGNNTHQKLIDAFISLSGKSFAICSLLYDIVALLC